MDRSVGVAVVAVVIAAGACGSTEDGRTASRDGETITCVGDTRVRRTTTTLCCERPDGREHGPYIEWSRDAVADRWYKALEGVYVAGRKQGVWIQYHQDGGKSAGSVHDNQKHGTWQHWNARGAVVETEEYDRGKMTKRTTHEAGDVVRTRTWTTTDAGIVVESNEEVVGSMPGKRVTIVQHRDGKTTYHERADGTLTKIERLRSGSREHVTECDGGKPVYVYEIAGNNTPGHPRHRVPVDLATASPCDRKQLE